MTALRLAAVLLCLLYASEAFHRPRKCCTELGERISIATLNKVKSYEIQRRDGSCHLHAVRLHLENKTLCMNHWNKRVKKWIERQRERKVLATTNPRKITEEEKF